MYRSRTVASSKLFLQRSLHSEYWHCTANTKQMTSLPMHTVCEMKEEWNPVSYLSSILAITNTSNNLLIQIQPKIANKLIRVLYTAGTSNILQTVLHTTTVKTRNVDCTSRRCCPESEILLVYGRNQLRTSPEVRRCSDTGTHPRISAAPKYYTLQ